MKTTAIEHAISAAEGEGMIDAAEARAELEAILEMSANFRRTACIGMGIPYHESDDTPYINEQIELVARRADEWRQKYDVELPVILKENTALKAELAAKDKQIQAALKGTQE